MVSAPTMSPLSTLLLLLPSSLFALPQESAKVWEQPCGMLPFEIFPEQVEPYHLPWLVRVGYEKKGRMQYGCTGTLIDRQHVLTAAHCVSVTKKPTRVQIRNCDDESSRCGGTPRSYGVSSVFTHPQFKSLSTSFDYDIAVVRLDRDVNLAVGTKATPGNGPPRAIAVPPVPLDTCQEQYGDAIKLTPQLQMCAGGEGNEPCRGDAGAPLQKAPKVIEYAPKSKSKPGSVVSIWKNMTVLELASAMHKNVFMYVDNSVNYDTPETIIDNMLVIQNAVKKSGMKYKIIPPPSRANEIAEPRIKDITRRPPADPSKLVPRPPVVTIMGHVDHGKTTLLDSLRHSRVVDKEFGGITQHIGAFSVQLPGSSESITFLDTPGHAAFTAMRARGADATDIVVLARTREMLLNQGLQLEEEGGDVQSVPISALAGTNLPQLIDAIALQSELMELKADPTGLVEGLVIESQTDAKRGKLSTALVQRGTIRRGCILVSGVAWAKVRAMFDDAGRPLNEAPPATPVEILGWRELPMAGDDILEVESERVAHEIVKFRESSKLQQKQENDKDILMAKAAEHRKILLGRRVFQVALASYGLPGCSNGSLPTLCKIVS
ncbi:hypothetical protein B566_EDAN009859 [Ephemera danica]|nr:hypothetical protein B566_EDAN009859 [Ephemera danica]